MPKQVSSSVTTLGEGLLRQRWVLVLLLLALLSVAFLIRDGFQSLQCDCHGIEVGVENKLQTHSPLTRPPPIVEPPISSPLSFMKSKLVLLVSHELSLFGGPLLLMELEFLLRNVGAEIKWITTQKPSEIDNVIYSLERKMLDRGVQTYQHQHNKQMSCPVMAQLLSNTLYYKRFFPYYSFNVLGGLDSEGMGCVYTYDAVGSYERVGFSSHGSGSTLIMPFLDNQLKSPSPLLLPAKGDKLEIVVLNANGTRREYMELRKD